MPNHFPCTCQRDAVLAIAGLLLATAANADSLDTWNVSVGTSVSHDRNVFHLSDTADAQALTGSSDKSDVVTASNVGLKVSKPYSLQRFELDLGLVKYDYRKFDYLNFTATNYAAAWRWSLTPNLRGNLSSGRRQSLNSFTDNQNFRTRNIRTDDNYRFDADLDLSAGWHLLGGAFQTRRKNSATFIQERDNTVTSSEFGGRYEFSSGTSLGYLNRTGRGTYDNLEQPIPFPTLLDNKFAQTENLVFMSWPITVQTGLSGRIGQLKRKHDNYSARDYSGMVGGLDLNWVPGGKSHFKAGWARSLSSYETLYSSYSRIDRYFVSPVWQVGAKTALRFRYDYIKQDYLGGIAPDAATGRSDGERVALIAFDWQALDSLALTVSFTDDKRTSNIVGRDFKDRIALFSLQFGF
jgi:exopolysaccharide biosynthesis operon protein EpsL